MKAKWLELKLDIPKKDIEIYADGDKITQVFVNLVGNALKFTEKGHIEISVRDRKGEIECSVADTGAGIGKGDLPRVFDKFRQFGRQDGPGDRGTGLGLSISKGIIEMHQGSIWVESERGKGTKFTFTLPKYTTEALFQEYVGNGVDDAIRSDSKMSLIYVSISEFDRLKKEMNMKVLRPIIKQMENSTTLLD